MLTPTTSTTRSRQLAASTIGRPLLTMLQTVLTGATATTTPEASAPPRRWTPALRRR
jgi:hypothetical protein